MFQPTDQHSELRLYSLALAAENLVVGSKELQCTPYEALMFVDGALKANPTPETLSMQDASGNSVQTKVTTDNTITATWFPFHSNRVSAPTVRRGEHVLLFRYADTDNYLWTELGLDMALRSGEIAQYAWNATPNKGGAEPSKANSYFLEINTLTGAVTFSTSKANNEKCTYTFQLNPMAGQFTFLDDIGQAVFMDSVNHIVHLVNADKTEVTLDKQDVLIQCADTFTLQADKTVSIQTQEFNLKAKDVTVNASAEVHVTANNIVMDAPTLTLGKVQISGGNVACDSLTSKGLITTAGVNSSAPVHAPNIS